MSTNYNRPEIVKFLTFIAGGRSAPRELRCLMPHGKIWSGIFDDVERMASAACGITLDHHPLGVYFGLHHPGRHFITRALNKVQKNARHCVRASHIVYGGVLLVDVDPVRPSGVCATDSEKAEAWSVATRVRDYLTSQGWPEPVAVDSGNGYHLYYRDYGCRGGHEWRYILGWLARTFDTDEAKVDTSVWDAARISRLPGTMNCKGPNTPDRPHRMARVLSYTDAWTEVPHLYHFAVDRGYVPPMQPWHYAERRDRGDLPELLIDEEGVGQLIDEFPDHLDLYRSVPKDGRTYFYLRSCPFNGGRHRDQGAKTAIILSQETIGFKCFSSDCENFGFRDLLDLLKEETGRKPSMPIYKEVQHGIVMGRYLPKWGCEIVDVQREEDRAKRKAERKAERKAARKAARRAERKAKRRESAAWDEYETLEDARLTLEMRLSDPEFRWEYNTFKAERDGLCEQMSSDPSDWELTLADLIPTIQRVKMEEGWQPRKLLNNNLRVTVRDLVHASYRDGVLQAQTHPISTTQQAYRENTGLRHYYDHEIMSDTSCIDRRVLDMALRLAVDSTDCVAAYHVPRMLKEIGAWLGPARLWHAYRHKHRPVFGRDKWGDWGNINELHYPSDNYFREHDLDDAFQPCYPPGTGPLGPF